MKIRKSSIWVYLVLIVVLLGVGFWIYRVKFKQTKSVVVGPTTNFWEKSVEEAYSSAKQVEPDGATKLLADELSPIIKNTVKNDIKLSESTDKKLVFTLKTIVVEGDVDNIGKALEGKGYRDVAITDQYKKMTAKKDNKTITFAFSVDTTTQGKIEITLSP